MAKRTNITGRDGYIQASALAYAINIIDRLPEEFQELSDREDMHDILVARAGKHGATRMLEEVQLRFDQAFDGISIEEVKVRMAQMYNIPSDDVA